MTLRASYFNGARDALFLYRVAEIKPPTVPGVKKPSITGSTQGTAKAIDSSLKPEITSTALASVQSSALAQPRKIAGEAICTTCRQAKHYGPCKKSTVPTPGPGSPHKAANFNMGMYGNGNESVPTGARALGTNYSSAVVGESNLTRARSGRPDDQAASAARELSRGQGSSIADQSTQSYGGLTKTCEAMGLGFTPAPNPYEQRPQHMAPFFGGPQATVDQAFRSFDVMPNQTSIENVEPAAGPLG